MIKAIAPPPSHPGIRTAFTSYYLPHNITPGSGVTAFVANVIYYHLFFLGPAVVDRIGVEITTGAAGAARLGLYANNNGMPGALIRDCGTVDTSSNAIVEASFTALTLPNDWFWAAVISDSTAGCRAGAIGPSSPLGNPTLSNGSARGLSRTSVTYGVLADPAPVPTAFSTAMPLISLRKS